ncbi:uncharacterized protein DUF1599 [Balneicella halophila]|uniref:Uncharacterized protein DUF1599 n=1 Tax=Balneicella halophila TaxID=1537566 RepID=A0A7L4USV5_BALHA|nr:DUF1599 domain-containing protein [Balneicella halophila]PVX52551.1 uncharacterized protein DUF1599 [Balneicella halophila]
MANTSESYDAIIKECSSIFEKKMHDYGAAWRIMRVSSVTDQLLIKAKRIRSLQEKGKSLIDEGQESEFKGIINYCIIGLIQLELGPASEEHEIHIPNIIERYHTNFQKAKSLMEKKNHDYGEAWRMMRVSSITDLILMKIYRTKQIEDLGGKTLISEGIDANYLDMINYAVFALILLENN